jgi:hypothetical protein
MHRRRVLESVGSFHPYLHSDEEPELCIRIRHAGWRVMDVGTQVALHYSAPSRRVSTVVARWRRGLFLGAGQSIRQHVGSDLLWPYLRERGYGVVPGLALAAGTGTVVAGIARGRWRPLALCAALSSLTLGAHAARRGSVSETAYSVVQRLCILDGTIRGFLVAPRPGWTHPARFDVVRTSGSPSGSVEVASR